MSQWERDENGKRIHKRQCKRKACAVYFYKYIHIFEDAVPVYTARPKSFRVYLYRRGPISCFMDSRGVLLEGGIV